MYYGMVINWLLIFNIQENILINLFLRKVLKKLYKKNVFENFIIPV